MTNPFLIGDKVYLRTLERADAPTVQPWINDPDVAHFILSRQPINLQAEEQFIDHVNQSAHDFAYVIVRRDTDEPIGVTGFHRWHSLNRNAAFGISLGVKEVWGMGFGTEVTALMIEYGFQKLNLHRIQLEVFEYNERGLRVYEKLGFQKEGVLRQDNYRQGRYWDTIVMGLLRDEWESRREM